MLRLAMYLIDEMQIVTRASICAIEAGQNWPLRGELYCVGCLDGGTYLRPAGGNLAFRIPNIDHILARFPRDDDGPCAMWFYRLHAKKRDIALDIETDKQWWDRAYIHVPIDSKKEQFFSLRLMCMHKVYTKRVTEIVFIWTRKQHLELTHPVRQTEFRTLRYPY